MSVKRPALIIHEEIVRRNIGRMVKRAQKWNTVFRPHFKTHHSHEIGRWYREAGVTCITVSSVAMAHYFMEDDWNDITIAFPYNPLEWQEVNEIAEKISLNILIESREALDHAKKHLTSQLGYFIEIDTGSNRTGLTINELDLIRELSSATTDILICRGYLSHAGHTYTARSEEQILEIHKQSLTRVLEIRDNVDKNLMISYGDTPSASVADDFSMIEEVRPGNLVYYDLAQAQIGSCRETDIGVALACPVVSLHPQKGKMVVYGGAVHLSKDRIAVNGHTIFGKVVRFYENGWEIIEELVVDRLSQEHGVIEGPAEKIKSFKIGEVIGILPVHSCLTADLMTAQQTLSGKKITKMPKI